MSLAPYREIFIRGLIEEHKEALSKMPYVERTKDIYEGYRFWEYLDYTKEGDLSLNGLKIVDILGSISQATNGEHHGTPVEIVDPSITALRGKQFIELSGKVKEDIGYTGGLEYLYATKASPAAEIVSAALSAGWDLETSSEQDLYNIQWMYDQGLLPEKTQIVCNGFKPDPDKLIPFPLRSIVLPVTGEVTDTMRTTGHSYAEMIVKAQKEGLTVVPVFDSESEVGFFGRSGVEMDVGLRLKAYDAAKHKGDFESLVARHGMNTERMWRAASEVEKYQNLNLTIFHAMIGAAESIPINKHVDALLKASDIFFDMQRHYPSMIVFNMGGGIPPTGTKKYNHEEFLQKFLSGMKMKAEKAGRPMPIIQFEFGSYMAAEAAIAPMRVQEIKVNNPARLGERSIPWAIVDYSLMRGLIDMMLIGERYIFLAGNYGNLPAVPMRIGDITCDHDGYVRSNPLESQFIPENTVLLPDITKLRSDQMKEPLIVVPIGIQAYEETLTGIGGVGHCQLGEPIDAIIYPDEDGKRSVYIQKLMGPTRTRDVLGYDNTFKPILESVLRQK